MPNPNLTTTRHPVSIPLFLLAVGLALGLVFWRAHQETERANYLNAQAEWSSPPPEPAPDSPTGQTLGQRTTFIADHDRQAFDFVALTQQMLAGDEWRIRRIAYANAPAGHDTALPSLYAWTLAGTASALHGVNGRTDGWNVERAAQFINLGSLALAVAGLAFFTGRLFGHAAGALLALGLAALFPLCALFPVGTPSPSGLHALLLLASLLALAGGARRLAVVPGVEPSGPALRAARCYWLAAGALGALALWLDLPVALPFLGGIAGAGLMLAFLSTAPGRHLLPWRWWGGAGGAVIIAGWFLDYFPARGDALRSLHPLYALAWLGAAELLAATSAAGLNRAGWNARRITGAALGTAALLQLPVALARAHLDLFSLDRPDAFRLEPLSAIAAPGLSAWLARDGLSWEAAAALLPLGLVVIAGFIFQRTDAARRLELALAAGALIPSLALGAHQLSAWGQMDAALLGLLVVALGALKLTSRNGLGWATAVALGLALAPGLLLRVQPIVRDAALSSSELEAYLERDLAHWLRQHASAPPVVLAPPRVSGALAYYGGFSGLGSFDRNNTAGNAAAVRLVSASSHEEALALATSRQLTHIVIPFWDTYLNEYLGQALGENPGRDRVDASLLASLKRWDLPAWLRPLPYRLPPGPGVDGTIVIFEVVEEQPPAVAAARLVEYFLEMDQSGLAADRAGALAQFPNDLGALAVASSFAVTTNDETVIAAARQKLLAAVARPERGRLPWDRRVSLAIALAQLKRADLARPQLVKCLGEIDADKLRSLTPVSLYRFLLLCKLHTLEAADPGLMELGRSLLRPDLRARL